MTTIMVIAGEASGDALGGPLLTELKRQRPDLNFIGVGGPLMAQAGLKSIFPMRDLSVMGLLEVVPQIPKILGRLNQLLRVAQQEHVDLLLTIDAQDFSKRLAKKMKRRLGVPCVHYVAPTVWAWRPSRAAAMRGVIDHVLALYPFEPPYFEKAGVPCTFVGHPVVDRLKAYAATVPRTPPNTTLAVLPGSRRGEITRHWPTMWQAVQQLKQTMPDLRVCLAVTEQTRSLLPKNLPDWVSVPQEQEKYAALQQCRAALAKSGTGNLELAVLGVPMVVCYRLNPITAILARWLVDIPYASPVNWVAGHRIVPEFLQQAMTVPQLTQALKPMFGNDHTWKQQQARLISVTNQLKKGEKPTLIAAKVILKYLT